MSICYVMCNNVNYISETHFLTENISSIFEHTGVELPVIITTLLS